MARFLRILVIVGAAHCLFNSAALAGDESPSPLESQKLQAEISKLQAEVEELRGGTRIWTTWLGALGGVAGAFVALAAIWLGDRLRKRMDVAQQRKLKQERELEREKHNLALFLALAKAPREQIAAASVLLQRLRESRDGDGADGAGDKNNQRERFTISQVLVSTIKAQDTDSNLCKMIGDNLVRSMGAVVPVGKEPAKRYSPLLGTESPEVEPKIDFQGVRLTGVWWKRVDARGIDFFDAHLNGAGLAEAFLRDAIFYRADLSGSVLRQADLRGANLVEANLEGCNLRGANLEGCDLRGCRLQDAKYDERTTTWPDGFDPVAAGAVAVA